MSFSTALTPARTLQTQISVPLNVVGTPDEYLLVSLAFTAITLGTNIGSTLQGPQGLPGMSAYEVAVANGYVGDEPSWLASLEGPEGPASTAPGPPGDDGSFLNAWQNTWNPVNLYPEGVIVFYLGVTTAGSYIRTAANPAEVGVPPPGNASWDPVAIGFEGPNGPVGDSAYQVALDNGFVGTEAEWIASLEGPPGNDSTVPGPDGDSAYQVAVNNGFVGSEAAWLASLEGTPGDDGLPGDSAYQVAVNNGYVGDEASWLASLEGAPGSDATVTEANIELALGGTVRQWPKIAGGAGGTLICGPFAGTHSSNRLGLTASTNRVYVCPGEVVDPTRISLPHVNINTTVGGATARCGLVSFDPETWEILALLHDWGTADISTPGYKSFTLGATTYDMLPGTYYAVILGTTGVGNGLYYMPYEPVGLPIWIEGSTISCIIGGWFTDPGGAQVGAGWSSPPAGLINIDSAVNVPGYRSPVYFKSLERIP